MNLRFFNLFIIFITISTGLLAQENTGALCTNGVDDDGDGLIDCYDDDCSSLSVCDGFFVSTDANCNIPPPVLNFQMQNTHNTVNRNVHTQARIAIGDVDMDGIVDLITPHKWDQDLKVVSGVDGSETWTRSTSDIGNMKFRPELEIAIGDVLNIKADSCIEIFSIERDKGSCGGNDFCGDYYLSMYSCGGSSPRNPLTDRVYRNAIGPDRPGIMGLADFDGDGLTEVYYKNEIRAAETGVALIPRSGNWETEVNSGPVAADIIPSNPGLELVVGGLVYGVNNLTNRNSANSGALTLLSSLPSYFIKDMGYTTFSTTSVADMNGDGNLDVVISGATGSKDGPTAIFFWDVTNGTTDVYEPSNNWLWGTGRVNLFDVDGNGLMNATFITGSLLIVLELDAANQWQELFIRNIEDSQSGIVGVTVFDFDNDGIGEIVYRDSRYLTILDGSNGTVKNAIICQSHTEMEYPIIGDVNGDGSTNICVPCNFSDNFSSFKINDGLQQQGNGNSRVYEAQGETWVPTRRVWNQHGYHITNVNDNLTIPRVMQNQTTVFPGTGCSPGGSITPLNSFMNQSPALNENGCPSLPAADLDFVGRDSTSNNSGITVIPPQCPNTDFFASFKVGNFGDVIISQDLFITFYNGDPTQAGGIKLNTELIPITNLIPGDSIEIDSILISGPGTAFDLFIVLDDDGSTPVPISLPINGTAQECDYSNNINSQFIDPTPFLLSGNKIGDNFKCDPLAPDNGAVQAYIIDGVDSITTGFTFSWFMDDTTASGAPDFQGPIYNGLAAGTYTVFAVDDLVGCISDTITFEVFETIGTFVASVDVLDSLTNCLNPNGSLTASVNGITAGYTFEWYEGNAVFVSPVIGVGPTINSLDAITYSVVVIDNATGCFDIASNSVPNAIVVPDVTPTVVANVTSCINPNSGEVTADVNGITGGFTFEWFNGSSVKPTADFTGTTYTSIPAGFYTVTATDDVSQCTSLPVIVEVLDLTQVPVPAITELAQQTSCDSSTPSGILTGTADGTTDTGIYSFEWFRGQNTLAANLVSSGVNANNLSASIYTLKVTNLSSGCDSIAEYELMDAINIPVVTAVLDASQTICDPTRFDGQVSANVGGTIAGFTFHWFDGNVGSPFIPDADFIGDVYSGLPAGDYTVVAVDNTTNCESSPDVINIPDLTALPVIVITELAPQSSCLSNSPNGALTATADGSTVGFTFTWFNGQNTLPINQAGTGPTLSGVGEGTYTVEAINDITGCSETEEYTLVSAINIPVVSTIVQDQISCNPPDGSISANVAGGTAGFTFYWFDGNVLTPDTTIADFTGTDYTGLIAGDYTVIAVDNQTRCESDVLLNSVADLTIIPVLDTTIAHVTSCVIANGSISATADGSTDTGIYNFSWYNGQNTLPGNLITNSPTVTDLGPGIYTLFVETIATGCTATLEATIIDKTVFPLLSAQVDNEQTFCIPPNGQVSANVAGVTNGFSFYWFNANLATADTTLNDFIGPVYSGLTAGSYTVVAVDNITRCPSNIINLEVLDLTVVPVINTASIDQTSCVPNNPNGEVSADIGGSTVGFDFEWFEGQNTLPANSIGNTATVNGLDQGIYTVLVIETATGCFSTAEESITEIISIPTVVAIVDSDLTSCDVATPNGQASANVGGITAGFTFYWFDGNVASPDSTVADFSGPVYNGLATGFYTVVAVDNSSRCQSPREFVEIQDITVDPVPNTASVPQTSCDPASPNGEVSADVGGTTVGFSFEWFRGQNTLPANQIGNTATITGLTQDVYTVRVTNDITLCFETQEVSVTEIIAFPILDPLVPTDLTICSAPDGQIMATADGGQTIGYTFNWYDGTSVTATPDFIGATYTGLDVGDYTVVAVDNNTGCESDPLTATINDASPPITVTEFLAGRILPSTCDEFSGRLFVIASAPGNPPFTFEWFEGNADFTTPATGVITGVSPNSAIENIRSGRYTVRATNTITGCTEFIVIDLPFIDAQVITAVPSPATNCSTPPDGSISAVVSNFAFPTEQDDFTINLYEGDNITGPLVVSTVAGLINTVFNNLAPGNYTLEAIQNFGSNCPSIPVTVTVDDNSNPPVITITENSPVTNCNPATPNGELTANVGGVTLGYQFDWYNGPPPVSGVAAFTGSTFSGLTANDYTVVVRDLATQCTDTASINLQNNFDQIAITDISPFPQNDCDPPDGSVIVNFVDVISNGVSTPTNPGDFVFTWFASDGLTVLPGGVNINQYLGLAKGTYFVQAFNIASGCNSSLVQFDIGIAIEDPIIEIIQNAPNTNCAATGGQPNGILQANIINTNPNWLPFNASDYNYVWYMGQNNTNPADQLPPANISGLNGELAIQLDSGFYTVEVTRIADEGIGCTSFATLRVEDAPETILIEQVNIDPNDQDNCDPPNGFVEVLNINVNGVNIPANPADFTFTWFESDGITLLPDLTNSNIYDSLAAGIYFVEANRTSSGCITSKVQFEIKDMSPVPIIELLLDQPNTNCTDTLGILVANGQLRANIITAVFDPLEYSFNWFSGQNNTNPADQLPPANISGINGELAINLSPGFYTVAVEDDTPAGDGCISMATLNVPDAQDVITIELPNIILTNQNDCTPPNGTALVDSVAVDGTKIVASAANFNFRWFDANLVELPGPINGNSYTGLPAGRYFVQAFSITSGCNSSEVQFDIIEDLENPVILITEDMPNTNCNGSPPNGQLTATILVGGVADSPANYTFTWYSGQNNTTPADQLPPANIIGINGETAIGLTPGFFTVEVVKTAPIGLGNIGCSSISSLNVQNIPDQLLIQRLNVITTDNDNCTIPNGTAQVDSVSVNGVNFVASIASFTFRWLDTDGITELPGLVTANNYSGLNSGTYFIEVSSINSSCISGLVPYDIDDITAEPVVNINLDDFDTSCDPDPLVGNGALSATADGGLIIGYTFEWYAGTVAAVGPVLNLPGTNNITNQRNGLYTVRVTNILTNCFEDATFEIPENLDISEPAIATLIVDPLTNCTPLNGRIEATVTVGGNPALTTDHTFEWYFMTFDAAGLISGETTSILNNREAGIYYVRAINNLTGCISDIREKEIPDSRAFPIINLVSFAKPTRCDGVNEPGNLSVTANGSIDTGLFTFAWYNGGQPVVGPPFIVNNPQANGLSEGSYTIEITEVATGCSVYDTYTLQTDVNQIVLSASATPQSSCLTSNGEVFAVVTNSVSTFIYEWYLGSAVGTIPDFTGDRLTNLPIGEYTVVAIDSNDPFCVSDPVTVEITDIRMDPVLSINQDAPVSNCDTNRPNGQLTAFVNGNQVVGYTFEWFDGTDTTGTIIQSGNTLAQVSSGTYTVRARDNISGCVVIMSEEVIEEFPNIPSPDIEVLSNLTNCVELDGKLEASVNGSTSTHIFEWYIGNTPSGTPVYTGNLFDRLDIGTYTVVATDIATGCVSAPATAEILDERVFPEISFIITNEQCERSNGSIEVISLSELPFQSIEWDTPLGTVDGQGVYNTITGEYTVTVTGINQCQIMETGEIGIDIFNFNGISANNDGQNDFFEIACISLFPNNNVKIYNRNGTLVYEVNGYDNLSVFFDGIANRGMSILGDKVPDGTYFYIIDKGDGSKKISGYLELLR